MDKLLIGLISQLEELGELESSYFKARAYKNAALAINQEFMNDSELIACENYTYLSGIGSGIDKKIHEYLSTGEIAKLQTLRAENAAYLDPRFYKVRQGFITKKIKWRDATILLDEFWRRLDDTNSLKRVAQKYLGCKTINLEKLRKNSVIAGSYRRMKDYIGDLDLLIPANQYEAVISRCDDIFHKISSGSSKSQYLLDSENNIPLDVISYTDEDYIYQLLYLTGSRETNIRMRKAAQEKGLRLNQYGLWNSEEENVLEYPSNEEDVFDYLGMKYLEPEER